MPPYHQTNTLIGFEHFGVGRVRTLNVLLDDKRLYQLR